jgi:histidyl-tRNA synthetase
MSAVGFAPGLSTMELFLESHNLIPAHATAQSVTAYVVSVGDNMTNALIVAATIRKAGFDAEVDITERKLDKRIKTASNKNIPYVVFVGDDEVKEQVFTIRNLQTGEQAKIAPDAFGSFFVSDSPDQPS